MHLTDFTGILQADAYPGNERLYGGTRSPVPVSQALCWSHARRKFFELADIAKNAPSWKKRGINASWLWLHRLFCAQYPYTDSLID